MSCTLNRVKFCKTIRIDSDMMDYKITLTNGKTIEGKGSINDLRRALEKNQEEANAYYKRVLDEISKKSGFNTPKVRGVDRSD